MLSVYFLSVEFLGAMHTVSCAGSIFFPPFFLFYIDGIISHNALGEEAEGELWHLGLISSMQRCLWGDDAD